MSQNNGFTPPRDDGLYFGNKLLEYNHPSNFTTLQFLVSSEIADILLFRREPVSRSSTTCQIDSIANVARLAATRSTLPPSQQRPGKEIHSACLLASHHY